jgi:hypothetical protein
MEESESRDTENDLKDANEVEGTEKKGEMPAKKRIHVVKRGEGWAVKKEGASKASRIYQNKEDAVERAINFMRTGGYDLIIHSKDGTFQKVVISKKTRTIKTPKVTGTVSRQAMEQAAKKVIYKKRNK